MSDLSKIAETASWIKEARSAGWDKLPPDRCNSIAYVAEEQARNLASIEATRDRTGRAPTWCSIEEYRECVRMLREAAKECSLPQTQEKAP